jgi:hypothetical protein
MKQLKEIIFEKLKIGKTSFMLEKLKINSKSKVEQQEYKYHPKDRVELIKIVDERIKKENDNIDFNDIDTSNIDDMEGIFAYKGKLTKIDISEWNVSGVKCMMEMFAGCKKLESIGDISDWKIESLTDITGMFYGCDKLTNTGDLNKWNASKIKLKQNAFSQANEYIIPKWA